MIDDTDKINADWTQQYYSCHLASYAIIPGVLIKAFMIQNRPRAMRTGIGALNSCLRF